MAASSRSAWAIGGGTRRPRSRNGEMKRFPLDFDNVKAEKENAMRRYNLLTSIAETFRIVDLCVTLVLLSWIVTYLPFTIKIVDDYIQKLSGFIGSPLFIFMILNATIATLVVKSG